MSITDLKLMEMESRIYQAIRYKRLAGVMGLVRELIAEIRRLRKHR